MNLSEKQHEIMKFLRSNETITKKQAVSMLGSCYYRNGAKYVGEILSRMVNKGLLVREKAGLFRRPKPYDKPVSVDPRQIDLF